MNLLIFLNKLRSKLGAIKNENSNYPYKEQKKYLDSIKEPKDDIARSYAQYCCYMKMNGKFINVLYNLVSLPLLFIYYFRKNSNLTDKRHIEAVFFADGKPDNIIPKELHEQFSTWVTIKNKEEFLTAKDKKFFLGICKRYPLSWHFLLKSLVKIRFYSCVIEKHNPKAIVVCNEYSFTSSLLTAYCTQKNIRHIDVMHGEIGRFIINAFFRYDDCYVWDKYYAEMCTELRADPKQFIIAIPDSLIFANDYPYDEKIYDYIYYLGAEGKKELLCIVNMLNMFVESGYKVAIRPHPRYTNMDGVDKNICKFDIEDIKTVTIEKSILSTKNAIAVGSTVLNQAYRNGTTVVINDFSNRKEYEKLEDTGFIMLQKPHKLLSEILENIDEENN